MYKERIAGIVLGILLGIGIVAIFVFVFSEDAIDSASLGGQSSQTGSTQSTTTQAPKQPPKPEKPKSVEVTVQVVGGAPPSSTGPAHLDATQGDKVTFNVVSDLTGTLKVTGYGISKTVKPGRTPITFTASKPGNYALINATTTIAVAQLRVSPR
jgi:hypothetical protein